MKRRTAGLALLGLAGAVALGIAAAVRQPEIPPELPSARVPDAAAAARGEALAALGNCAVCHAGTDGRPYAGGRPVVTPFGTIHATNITPDVETGIGTWSLAAFTRAMREGVARDGRHLYPAFPYDHFTRVTDEDIAAVYAHLMAQAPAVSVPPANTLRFPFDQRILLAGWNALFLDAGPFVPDPSRSDAWNRGAYLAEGLGHCGACHTPRNALGALDQGRHLGGATNAGWHAPALGDGSPAPVPWTADALVNYFLDGWDRDHGIAAGPMTKVVDQMAALSEEDAYAIAEYVLSFQSDAESARDAAVAFAAALYFGSPETPAAGPAMEDPVLVAGRDTFARVCANCHRTGTQAAPLALTSTVNGPDPSNLLRIIDEGVTPPAASFDRTMPGFRGALSEEDLVALAAFLRAHFSREPAWPDLAARVAAIRAGD